MGQKKARWNQEGIGDSDMYGGVDIYGYIYRGMEVVHICQTFRSAEAEGPGIPKPLLGVPWSAHRSLAPNRNHKASANGK
jgi:hypothetical protein